jgi:hypothetical protein
MIWIVSVALILVLNIGSLWNVEAFYPSDMMIATVLDPTSAAVTRDVFTLLRSIRLNGGSLNDATIVVAIALERNTTLMDETALLGQLHALDVEVIFIDQVPFPKPKTLNKFSTFSFFDPLRYHYFLWLDADIFVANDPMPYLSHFHTSPGYIECTPEFFNYLKRYPNLNETAVLWNTAMSQLRTIGEGDDVPMGVCNTGVLLFDAMSLQRFMSILPEAERQIDALNVKERDRFIDSLYFVAAVNMASIHVHPFQYTY